MCYPKVDTLPTKRVVVIQHECFDTGTTFMGQRIFIESTGDAHRDDRTKERWKRWIANYMGRMWPTPSSLGRDLDAY